MKRVAKQLMKQSFATGNEFSAHGEVSRASPHYGSATPSFFLDIQPFLPYNKFDKLQSTIVFSCGAANVGWHIKPSTDRSINKIFAICKALLRNCKVDAVVFLSLICYNRDTKLRRNDYETVRQADRA